MAPISSFSLSIGTTRSVRAPASLSGSGSASFARRPVRVWMSAIYVCFGQHACEPRPGGGTTSVAPALLRQTRAAHHAARQRGKCPFSYRYRHAELGLADARRVRQHGLEHRLKLAGRARDDLQHLRGRGLLLQCLGEVARARLHLVEQPHVLDRDHRLVGEGRDQLDLLVGERPHRRAGQHHDADRSSLAHKRDPQHRTEAGELPALR